MARPAQLSWTRNRGTTLVLDLADIGSVRDGEWLQPRAQVGRSPVGIAFDGLNLWIANHLEGTITKVDPVTRAPLATILVGAGPRGVVFDGHHIWVTNYWAGSVSKINVRSDAVSATVVVGGNPAEAAFDGSSLWVPSSGYLTQIDVRTNLVVWTSPSPVGGRDVLFDGTYIWVSDYSGGRIQLFDRRSHGIVATVSVFRPAALVFDGSNVWVSGQSTLRKIDAVTRTVVASIVAPDGNLVFDGSHVWVASGGMITKVDAANNRIDAVVPSDLVLWGWAHMAFDGTHVWITGFDENQIGSTPAYW